MWEGQTDMIHILLNLIFLLLKPHLQFLYAKIQTPASNKGAESAKSSLRYVNVINIIGGMWVNLPPESNWMGYDSCCTIAKSILQHITVHADKNDQGTQQNLLF